MMDRIIFLGTGIDDQIANIVQAQLLFLSADASKYSDLFEFSWRKCLCRIRIYDTMQYIKPDVATICTGMAASMGAVLLCAGAPGKRSALPHQE
jgi:ATP-dependent Clp protease protease subunit